MDPLPTLDVLLAATDPVTGKDRLTRAVEAAIAGTIAELEAIEAVDAASGPASAYLFDRPVATAVRAMFEAWVAVAEPLEVRVADAVARAGPMKGSDLLRRKVGRTLARLTITLEDEEQSVQDLADGRVTRFASVEEMRRELLRTDVPRSGPGAVRPVEPVGAGSGA